MDMIGSDRKKAKRPAVNIRPSMAFVGVGGMVPCMVRAIEDITRMINMIKNSGLFLALYMDERWL